MRLKLNGLPRATTIGDISRLLAPWSPRDIFRVNDHHGGGALAYASIPDDLAAVAIATLDRAEFLGRRLTCRVVAAPRWELRQQF